MSTRRSTVLSLPFQLGFLPMKMPLNGAFTLAQLVILQLANRLRIVTEAAAAAAFGNFHQHFSCASRAAWAEMIFDAFNGKSV